MHAPAAAIWAITISATLLSGPSLAARSKPGLLCRVKVPARFKQGNVSGLPERQRYRTAFESFWWNCASVKARRLQARCPFVCSGTPAAAAGCADGATDAESQIRRVVKLRGRVKAKRLVRSVAKTAAIKRKLAPYFKRPTPER